MALLLTNFVRSIDKNKPMFLRYFSYFSLLFSIFTTALISYTTEKVVAEEGSTSKNNSTEQVLPSAQAYQDMLRLVERYGCISNINNRLNRSGALTRYEFAAALDFCGEKINELISSGLADKIIKEDIVSLQKLKREFAGELTSWRRQANASKLEQRFSNRSTPIRCPAIFQITPSPSHQ